MDNLDISGKTKLKTLKMKKSRKSRNNIKQHQNNYNKLSGSAAISAFFLHYLLYFHILFLHTNIGLGVQGE